MTQRTDRRSIQERREDGWFRLKGWTWFSERRKTIERRNGFDRRQRVARPYVT